MDSKTSKAKRPTTVKSEAVIIPRISQDVIDEILDHLATDSDSSGALPSSEHLPFSESEAELQPILACAFVSLQACALVSRSWAQSCRRHLFHTVFFTSRNTRRWFKTFPVPRESPAHHVRDLRIWIGGDTRGVPERFFEHTPWFGNVEELSLLGHGGIRPYRNLRFGGYRGLQPL